MNGKNLPPREFVRSIREYCAEHELLSPGNTVVVGVSGGPDSVALLLALHELSAALDLHLRVAHLNHAIRRESAGDAEFVRSLAGELGIPAVTGRVDVRGLARRTGCSLEEAGRMARYRFFLSTAGKARASLVAVGHNRDDQAETVLLRLLRGSSGSGLAGMSPKRELLDPFTGLHVRKKVHVIRPLLARSRREIEAFLRLRGRRVRKDPSNDDTAFMRNRIRHDLLPFLEGRFNPQVRVLLARAAQAVAEDDSLLDESASGLFRRHSRSVKGIVRLDARAVSRAPLPVRRRILRFASVAAGVDMRRLSQPHLDALVRLLSARSGDSHLPGVVATCSARSLVFRPAGKR